MDYYNASHLDLPIQDSEVAEDSRAAILKLIQRSKVDTTAYSSYIEKVQNIDSSQEQYITPDTQRFSDPEVVDIRAASTKAFEGSKHKIFMGLLPEIESYWITSDSRLHIYRVSDNAEVVYDKIQDVIVTVHLARVVKDHFQKQAQYVLVITTARFIHLVAVEHSHAYTKLHDTHYKVPTNGIIYTTITSTPEGRIFLSGNSPQITEITYTSRRRFWKNSLSKKSVISSYSNLLIPNPIREHIPKTYLLHGDDSFKQLVYDSKTHSLYALSNNNVICVFSVPIAGGIIRSTRYSRFAKDYGGNEKLSILSISSLLPEERTDSPRRIDLSAILSNGDRAYFQLARQKYKGTSSLIYVASRRPHLEDMSLAPEVSHPTYAGTTIMVSRPTNNNDRVTTTVHFSSFSLKSYDPSCNTLIEDYFEHNVEGVVLDVSLAPIKSLRGFDISTIDKCPPVAQMFFEPRKYYVLTNSKLYVFTEHYFRESVKETLQNLSLDRSTINSISITSSPQYLDLVKRYGQHEAFVMLVSLSAAAARTLTDPVHPLEFYLDNQKSDAYSVTPAHLLTTLLHNRDTAQAVVDAIYDWIARMLSPIWNYSILDRHNFNNHMDIALIEHIELALISFRCLMEMKLSFLSSDNPIYVNPDGLITRCVQVLLVLRRGLTAPTLNAIEGSNKTSINRVRRVDDSYSKLNKFDVSFSHLVCEARNTIVREFITAYMSLDNSSLLPEDRTSYVAEPNLSLYKTSENDRKVVSLLRNHADRYFLEADYTREEVKKLCRQGKYDDAYKTLYLAVSATGSEKTSILSPIDDFIVAFEKQPCYIAKVCKLAVIYSTAPTEDLLNKLKPLLMTNTYCIKASGEVLRQHPDIALLQESEIENAKLPEAKKWNNSLYNYVYSMDSELNKSFILSFTSDQNIAFLANRDKKRLAEKYIEAGDKARAAFIYYKLSCEAAAIEEAINHIESSINFAYAASFSSQSFDCFPKEFQPRVISHLKLTRVLYKIQETLSKQPSSSNQIKNSDVSKKVMTLEELKEFSKVQYPCQFLCLCYVERIEKSMSNDYINQDDNAAVREAWNSILLKDDSSHTATFEAIYTITNLDVEETYGILNTIVPFQEIISTLKATSGFQLQESYNHFNKCNNNRAITWLLTGIFESLSTPTSTLFGNAEYEDILSICDRIIPVYARGSFPFKSELVRVLEALSSGKFINEPVGEKARNLINKIK